MVKLLLTINRVDIQNNQIIRLDKIIAMHSLKTTWKHIRRTPYQSMAAMLTLFITLFITGIFSVATISSVVILRYFESKPQITVFFTDKAGKTEADSLTATLQSTGKVAQTKFVSKEDALNLYKEQNKNDPLLLEMVTADILPASLEVTTTKPEYLSDLEPVIKKTEGVEEVVYQRDVVESLLKWTRGIRIFLGGLVILLAVDAILIIIAITSMKIALRREEIEILRLVGASRWYIRSPFIMEGGMYGTVSAVWAWCAIVALILWNREMILSLFSVIPVMEALLAHPSDSLFILSSLGFLFSLSFIGFFLGSVGSYIAVNRFLKI